MSVAREKSYPEEKSALVPILLAILFYGLCALTAYLVFASPQSGTAMASIKTVLRGLGGNMAIMIPILFGYVGALMSMTAAGRRISVWKSILDGFDLILIMTAVHLFFAQDIMDSRMTIHTFANFVNKSCTAQLGGGALGAILCWPIYTSLGKWGGLLTVILITILSLTATGHTAAFIRWAREAVDRARHNNEQRRMERENEQMFDLDENEDRAARRDDAQTDEPRRTRQDRDAGNRYGEQNSAKNRSSEDAGSRSSEQDSARNRSSDEAGSRTSDESRRRASSNPSRANANQNRTNPNASRTRPTDENRSRAGESRPRSDASRRRSQASQEGYDPAADDLSNPRARIVEDVPNDKNIRLAHDDEPSLDVFTKSSKPKKSKSKIDRPEFLSEEKPAPKPPEDDSRKDDHPEIADIPEDLTIEPEPCDVLASADVKTPGKMKKLRRTHVEEEITYSYPPIDLLEPGEDVEHNYREEDMRKAKLLTDTLEEFHISTTLTGIAHGPAVTRFEILPAPGVKVSRIANLADDIAMHLAAMSVRIEAPIPGKAAVGVEIPNDKVEVVRLRDVLESPEACKSTSRIAVGLGKDNSGRYIVADIAKMPHVLIAGQTGSGKSVCINAIITSILFRASPEDVKMILIDPKVVELSIYNGIPHLVCPVVTECKKASSALGWAVAEMEKRYKKFAGKGVRDIKGYNKALEDGETKMPQMVIIIDELADLMMVAPGEVEDSICRLAQLARAAGMHLVIATQRPSVNVITGIIKANIPTRIAFSVASQVDSRTMIDHGGAEKLLGNGDMLFVPSGNKPIRVQGAWVSDEEVREITDYIKNNSTAEYDQDMIDKMDHESRSDAENEEADDEYDPKLPEAVEIVVEAGQASVSMLQRRMRIGYARAGRLIDEMQKRGIVSEADGAKPRSVLINREQMNDLFE